MKLPQSIHKGQRIPLPTQKLNFLSLSYSALVVKVCNAVLNLRLKNGTALISDHNIDLDIERAIADGGDAGGPLQCMMVKSVSADYLTCHTYNGTEGTTDILVAKPHAARQPLIATYGGVTYTYTYSAGPDSLNSERESDDGSTAEDQIVTPMWYSDELIQVARTDYSGVTVADVPITYIEVSPKCWAKIEV